MRHRPGICACRNDIGERFKSPLGHNIRLSDLQIYGKHPARGGQNRRLWTWGFHSLPDTAHSPISAIAAASLVAVGARGETAQRTPPADCAWQRQCGPTCQPGRPARPSRQPGAGTRTISRSRGEHDHKGADHLTIGHAGPAQPGNPRQSQTQPPLTSGALSVARLTCQSPTELSRALFQEDTS
jgi:hypothetical protein